MGYGRVVHEVCHPKQIDPRLVAAIIYQESRGEPWATRHEPAFYKKYISGKGYALPGMSDMLKAKMKHRKSLITEHYERSTSFGLMQIMGQTAREHGYDELWLTTLLKPEVNIRLGVAILEKLLAKYDTEQALLRWNGGSNKSYPSEVLKWRDNGECLYLLAA
jgi:hypothetical protein